KSPARLNLRGGRKILTGSTFAVLEAFAGAGLAVLLAFAFAGIAGEQAFGLEARAQVKVALDEGAGDAVTDGASLAVGAAALDIDPDVHLAGHGGDFERMVDDHAQGLGGEIIFERQAVDDDLAGAGGEADAGDGGLATTGAEEFRGGCHNNISYLMTASVAGCWAACGCLSPLKTLSLVMSLRPRRFLGTMPRTAWVMSCSGCFARICATD